MARLTALQKKIHEEMRGLSSDLLDRRRLGSTLGTQFSGARDIYAVLGYNKNPTYADYEWYYRRNEIAKGVINAPVSASWETFPTIEESDESDTPFEKATAEIITNFHLQQTFVRLDTLSSIGKYAVLLLGFKDGAANLSVPATTATGLLYVTPYPEGSAAITNYDTNPQSPRFGLPTKYSIKIGASTATATVLVDYTRVIHVAQECLTNPIEGTPQLEVIFDRLFDITKTVGGAAEAFWRLADPGVLFNMLEGFNTDGESKEKLEEKFYDFVHGLRRMLVTKGLDVKNLQQQIADPANHFSMLLDMVAAGKRIPKRVLLGSEIGELASTMDLVRWFRQIKSRREQFCEPVIIRPFIDRLVEVGVLPRDKKMQYNVKWDDLLTPSDKEKADVGSVRAAALASFLNSGGDSRVPLEIFLGWIGCIPQDIEKIMKEMPLLIDDDPLLNEPDITDPANRLNPVEA